MDGFSSTSRIFFDYVLISCEDSRKPFGMKTTLNEKEYWKKIYKFTYRITAYTLY